MTITIELTQDEERRVAEARSRGLDVDALLKGLIGALPAPPAIETVPRATTGAEAIAFWQREGVFGLFADRPDSAEFARQLRRQAETRGRDAA